MSARSPLKTRSPELRIASAVALIAAILLMASACGTDDPRPAAATQAASATDNARAAKAAFERGEAVLPDDLCPGDNQLLANVLHLDDLAAVGLPVSPTESGVYKAQGKGRYEVPNYPNSGQVNCSATLSSDASLYFELHRNGRGLAANYEVREKHTIAGTNFVIYRARKQGTIWAEATFPDSDSTVGATSLAIGLQQRADDPSVSEDDAAAALLAVAELVLPRVTYDPPAKIIAEKTAKSGAATPDWWFGCDSGNFVFKGVGPEAVFSALGEPAAEKVKLSDNPLGVGMLTDCRATNDTTRVSIIAVPPIGGLIETVDDILSTEEGAEARTIAGKRAAVFSDPKAMWPDGSAHLNIDGFSIIITAQDRDSRKLSDAQLKQMATSAAEAFLSQL